MEKIELPREQVEALQAFRDEVLPRLSHDEDKAELEKLEWYDMSVGFFIAKGIDTGIAVELASLLRYRLQYFDNEVKFV